MTTPQTTQQPRDAYRDSLTHVDEQGDVRMVDVSEKAETHRLAIAEGTILMHPETQAMVLEDRAKKGDVLACARVAGIMASKRTSELIPMCHPLMITKSKVEIAPIAAAGTTAPAGWEPPRADGRVGFHVTCTCGVTGVTGIEMEALTAASVACLTIYDMCKAVDRGMEIVDVRLLRKEGGRSGLWERGSMAGGTSASDGAEDAAATASVACAAPAEATAGAASTAQSASPDVSTASETSAAAVGSGPTPAETLNALDAVLTGLTPVLTDAISKLEPTSAAPKPPAAPAIAFIGYQNSGKTTLVEKVISILTARGLRVGSLKHHGHAGFDIDVPGKDSWRHAQAGSRHVGLISADRYAEYADTTQELPVEEMLARYTDVDVVIVEGYKAAGLPNIVVARSGVDRMRGKSSAELVDERTIALAGNDVVARQAPHGTRTIDINDARAVADAVLDHLSRVRSGQV